MDVFCSRLSPGEDAQWSQLAICARGAGGRVALASGQVATGAGGSSPVSLWKARSGAGN